MAPTAATTSGNHGSASASCHCGPGGYGRAGDGHDGEERDGADQAPPDAAGRAAPGPGGLSASGQRQTRERSHPPGQGAGDLDQRQRQQRSRCLAETRPEVEQRLEAELGEDEGVSRLGGLTRASVSRNLPLVVTNGSEMMTALGDPTRQAIFERLSVRPTAVGELAAALPVSRPAVSQHLKVLRDVGLVVDRQEGTRRIYEVDRAGLAVLRSYLDQFWNRSLAAFQTEVEQQERERDDGDD
jgi:DNA-binding transcriptional ArsR family regulator